MKSESEVAQSCPTLHDAMDCNLAGSSIHGIFQARVLEWGAIGGTQYVRQLLTNVKGEINNNTIIVGEFHTPLTPIDRSAKQKINKETQTLNDKIDQLDLIDIYRTFHPQTINFTFSSSAHRTFSRIDHILGHKSSLGKFKNI